MVETEKQRVKEVVQDIKLTLLSLHTILLFITKKNVDHNYHVCNTVDSISNNHITHAIYCCNTLLLQLSGDLPWDVEYSTLNSNCCDTPSELRDSLKKASAIKISVKIED